MSSPRRSAQDSPFHRGERAVQARMGVREKVEPIGQRIVRDSMPDEHRAFFAQLPFLVIGMVDGAGAPWTSMLTGAPGFVSSPDPRSLRIAARPGRGDPLADSLHA